WRRCRARRENPASRNVSPPARRDRAWRDLWDATSGPLQIGGVGGEAQRDAAIGDAVGVPVDAEMRIGGVDVTPRALERVALVDGAAARRGEDDVDRLGAEMRRIGAVAAPAHLVLDR